MAAIKPIYTIGVLGVRDYNGEVYVNQAHIDSIMNAHIERHSVPDGFSIVTGGGRGVEGLVIKWAESKGIPCRSIPPNIAQLGPKKAFTIRNNNIVAASDDVIVFWDGYVDMIIEAIMSAMHMQKRVTIYPLV